jgi:hypothetical protein
MFNKIFIKNSFKSKLKITNEYGYTFDIFGKTSVNRIMKVVWKLLDVRRDKY